MYICFCYAIFCRVSKPNHKTRSAPVKAIPSHKTSNEVQTHNNVVMVTMKSGVKGGDDGDEEDMGGGM